MEHVTDKDIETAVMLYTSTYNTATVEQMTQNQLRYRKYVAMLVNQLGIQEQTVNDIVWERYQEIRAREIKEEKMSRQWKMKRHI